MRLFACGLVTVLLLTGCSQKDSHAVNQSSSTAGGRTATLSNVFGARLSSGSTTSSDAGEGTAGAMTVASGAGSAGGTGGITITTASYGANVDRQAATNNAISDVRQTCNTRARCDYKVDFQQIGDPFPGKPKSYEVSYRCGDGPERHVAVPAEAGLGSVVPLHCP